MEGQEISEVLLSKVLADFDNRFESEYWNAKIITYESVKGIDIESFTQYGTSEYLNEDGIGYPVLRLNEFDSFFISSPAKYCNLIDGQTYDSLKLKKNDVLICRTNGNPKYVGKSALVPQDYDYAFASYLFRVRPNDNINSATLVTFMNSKYGRMEIERFSMLGNQANFSPAKFRQISIPLFSKEFNDNIEHIVYKAFELSEQSKELYVSAEIQLLEGLGLENWQPQRNNVNIKTIKESFLASERLDAEYYHQKHYELEQRLKQCNQMDFLGNICWINDKNVIPKDTEIYKYIELADVKQYGEISGCTIDFGAKLPTRARKLVKENQVIVSSVEGSLDSCALVTKDYDKALCSTGFFVIESDSITSETLLVMLKLKPIQQLLQRACTGSIMESMTYDTFPNVLLPIPKDEVQTVVTEKIRKSFALRRESKQLLEQAKKLVEDEIEKQNS